MSQGRISFVDTPASLIAKRVLSSHGVMTADGAQHKPGNTRRDSSMNKQRLTKPRSHSDAASTSLMQAESHSTDGHLSSVYVAYVKASAGWVSVPIVAILLVLLQSSIIGTSLWLSCWTADTFHYGNENYLAGYGVLGITQAILLYLLCKSITYFATRASDNTLQRATRSVIRSPMSFFDTTPQGRLINRFSKDVDTLDNSMADAIRLLLMTTGSTIAVFILITAYFYQFAFAIGPVIAVYVLIARFYRGSAREMKHHESTLRSGVFARFSEAIHGLPTIRSYGIQDQFTSSLYQSIDNMNSASFLTMAYQRWLSVRLDAIGLVLILSTGMLVVKASANVEPSIGGIVLAYILSVGQMLQFTVRYLAELDNNMISVERLQQYSTLLEREEPQNKRNLAVPASWPRKGDITFTSAYTPESVSPLKPWNTSFTSPQTHF